MKNFIYITSLFLICFNTKGQNNNKIALIKYELSIGSKDFINLIVSSSGMSEKAIVKILKDIKVDYTLMVNLKTKNSVFYLDTIKKAKGDRVGFGNLVRYGYKEEKKVDYTKIEFRNQNIFVKNNNFSYQWKITDETKKIGGFTCTKAISKVKGNKIIAWFTNEVPLPFGPNNLYGLPGLILKVSGFFNSTTLKSIKYIDDKTEFDKQFKKYKQKYNNEKEDEISKKMYLTKKGKMIQIVKKEMT